MEILVILLMAVSLAMDAFTVSVSNGIAITDFKIGHAIKIGIYFGFFQFIMPIIGFLLGNSITGLIQSFSSYVAFVLLSAIGLKMIYEATKGKENEEVNNGTAKSLLTPKRLIFLAIATSIDALAIGISLSVLSYNIIFSSIIIGVVSFVLSFLGAIIGRKIGILFKKKAEIAGGLTLILIGLNVIFNIF